MHDQKILDFSLTDVSVTNAYSVQILLYYLDITFLVFDVIVYNLCGNYGNNYADVKILMKNVFSNHINSFLVRKGSLQ